MPLRWPRGWITVGVGRQPRLPPRSAVIAVATLLQGRSGLTARSRTALRAVVDAFGVTDVGGYGPGGCTSGRIAGSDQSPATASTSC